MKLTMITLLGAIASLTSAAAISSRDTLPETLEFHNEKEIALFASANHTDTDNLTSRAAQDDISFYAHTWTTYSGEWCSPHYYDLEAQYHDQSPCYAYQLQRFSDKMNPCHRSWTMGGRWYFDLDWTTIPTQSARHSELLTWNNARLGDCFAVRHTNGFRSCQSYQIGNTFMKLAFCQVFF
ncbi:hypothetical protein OQA88_2202 [Cercophora sp. LCS_1]